MRFGPGAKNIEFMRRFSRKLTLSVCLIAPLTNRDHFAKSAPSIHLAKFQFNYRVVAELRKSSHSAPKLGLPDMISSLGGGGRGKADVEMAVA